MTVTKQYDRRSVLKMLLGIGSSLVGCTTQIRPEEPNNSFNDAEFEAKLSAILSKWEPAIDTHIHLLHPDLTGKSFAPKAQKMITGPIEERIAQLKSEMSEARIARAFAMPVINSTNDDPLGIAESLRITTSLPNVMIIAVADPRRSSPRHMTAVEKAIELHRDRIVGFKGYLGYVHAAPNDPGYHPYYKIASKYKLPIIFHTGDPFHLKSRIKYSQPTLVDEAAVAFPEVNFVLAHFGIPWHLDAAEVAWKNNNVWLETSGMFGLPRKRNPVNTLLVNGLPLPTALEGFVVSDFTNALSYLSRPDRVIFATDWPGTSMTMSRLLISSLIPKEHHKAVFFDNAHNLFLGAKA